MTKNNKKNLSKAIGKAENKPAETAKTSRSNSPSNLNLKYYVLAALAVVCLIIYAQTIGFDFINLDDDIYVYENPFVSRGFNFTNFKWALTAFHAANWHPLTWISHALDASFFGLNAGGHHAVNLIFHIINSTLLFVVVNKLTNAFWKSAIVAALFAVHPAHVESVAWIAERKDVLSTLFWLLTTWAYLRYTEERVESQESRVESQNELETNKYDESTKSKNKKNGSTSDFRHSTKYYILTILLFALGLMAKPMLVTLPFVLLLIDYWALERFDKWNASNLLPLIKEKLPLFALTAISAGVTIFAQKAGGAIQTIETISLSDRIFNAVISYAKYVVMLFYPVNLGVWYPFENNFSVAQITVSLVLLVGITAICCWQIRERKYLFVGWFWFLGTLVPVIGILQVGRQSLADRYTYIPYIGLSIAVIWLFGDIFERLKLSKTIIAAICGICLLALTVLSFRQVSYWKTSETLFVRTLSITGKNYLVKNNFCNYLEKKNRFDEATAQCQSAIADDPRLPDAYNTLGTVQIKQNKFDEAKANFEKAAQINPNFMLAYANLAVVETNQNNFDAAAENLKKAIGLDTGGFFDASRLLDAYSGLAVASLKQKNYAEAAEFFQKALEITPNNTDFQRNLALSLHKQGKSAEGIRILEETIRKNPNLPEVYNTLGLIYAEQNRKPEAIAQFQKALQISPNFTPAQNNLRMAMEQK
ncbi:MAG: tetratricopeptide repeat protein [Actinomycetota bacterium]